MRGEEYRYIMIQRETIQNFEKYKQSTIRANKILEKKQGAYLRIQIEILNKLTHRMKLGSCNSK